MALLPQRQLGLLPQRKAQLLPLDMGASVRAEAEGHQQRFGTPQGGYIPFPTMPTWQQVMQYAKEHPLDALAGVTAPIPLLGDATGLLADSVEMAQNPSATNAMLLGIGAATVAPSGAAGRMADALFDAGKDAAGTVKRIGGGLLVDAYHGTRASDKIENLNLGSPGSANEGAIFASPSGEIASLYADPSGQVVPVKIKMENPKIIDWSQTRAPEELATEKASSYADQFPTSWSPERMRHIIKEAKDGGYDGIVLENIEDIGGVQTQYIVFDPSQATPKFMQQPLPTDEASRMARAKEMGFDVENVFYHGTKGDVEEFDLSRIGQSDYGASGRGIYLTEDPGTANVYAQLAKGEGNPNILPVFVKSKNPFELDITMLPRSAEESKMLTQKIKDMGHDSIKVRDKTGLVVEMVVFDPNQVRSKFANFDPAKKNSADLLAGVAGGLLGLGAYNRLSAEEEY